MSTEVTEKPTGLIRQPPQNPNSVVGFLEVAKVFAASELVPATYRGKPANCLIAADIANRLGVSTISVMQNLYPINGRISWSSQFIIALINSCGKFSNLQYAMSGEGATRTCVAFAKNKDGDRLESPAVSMAMARGEGWLGKAGSKWQTMPELMLQYRAASFFGKLHCPEILMGMMTTEEAEDIPPEPQSAKKKTEMSDIASATKSDAVATGDPVIESEAESVEQQSPATDDQPAEAAATTTEAASQPAAVETTEAKAKRTRRTKAEMEAARAAESPAAGTEIATTATTVATSPTDSAPLADAPQVETLKWIGRVSNRIPLDRWLDVLAKRNGAKDESQLTFTQAAELILNLKTKWPDMVVPEFGKALKEANAAAGTLVTPTDIPFVPSDPADAEPLNAAVAGRATDDQVREMIHYRELLGISLVDWSTILSQKNVDSESQLSQSDADVFLRRLVAKHQKKTTSAGMASWGNAVAPDQPAMTDATAIKN